MRSRSFIDLGVEWDYVIEEDAETLHTDGPLHDAVIILVIVFFLHIYINLLNFVLICLCFWFGECFGVVCLFI